MMISRENDLVSVFEDDCFFSEKFNLVWNVVSNNLPENTEFVYLGGRFNKNYITKKSERNKRWDKVVNFLTRSKIINYQRIELHMHMLFLSQEQKTFKVCR